MSKKTFGTTSKGVEASLYEISNGGGLRVLLTDYGASVVSIFVKDKDGNERDVILGYDNVKSYEKEYSYFGATVGRYANRISDAKVNIDGVEYKLEANDNENSLHSGSNGFSKRFWTVKEQKADEITFEIEDADLEQGFPGNAVVDVTFKVTEENALAIIYNAKADKTTTFNMTNHSYFNLDGHQSGTLEYHMLKLFADSYIPIDQTSIPSGEIAPVAGTPFDFRAYKPISAAFQKDCVQIQNAAGLDHSFAVRSDAPIQAEAYSTESGIRLTCKTTQPAIHVYTANFVETPADLGKGGCAYGKRSAFCLETQNFPDAINHPNFPSPILRANTPYRQETQFHFSQKGEA